MYGGVDQLASDTSHGSSCWDVSQQRGNNYMQLQPPLRALTFSQPEVWPRWIKHFEHFRQASGLEEMEKEKQVSMLIYAMGDEADD